MLEIVQLSGRHILEHIIETNQSFDTIISCSDGKIGAHRLVLFTISPLFALLMEEETQRTNEMITIILPDISVFIMKLILQMSYHGALVYAKSEEQELCDAIEFLHVLYKYDFSISRVILKSNENVTAGPSTYTNSVDHSDENISDLGSGESEGEDRNANGENDRSANEENDRSANEENDRNANEENDRKANEEKDRSTRSTRRKSKPSLSTKSVKLKSKVCKKRKRKGKSAVFVTRGSVKKYIPTEAVKKRILLQSCTVKLDKSIADKILEFRRGNLKFILPDDSQTDPDPDPENSPARLFPIFEIRKLKAEQMLAEKREKMSNEGT